MRLRKGSLLTAEDKHQLKQAYKYCKVGAHSPDDYDEKTRHLLKKYYGVST